MCCDYSEMRQELELANPFEEGTIQGMILSDDKREVAYKFLLLFNIFEKNLVKSGSGTEILRKLCDDLGKEEWLKICAYNDYGSSFAKRYFESGPCGEEKFNDLFTKGEKILPVANDVRSILKRFAKEKRENDLLFAYSHIEKCKNDLFFAYMHIAYRFRNKFFHGLKGIPELNDPSQLECFKEINKMMYSLLRSMDDNNFKGLKEKYPKPRNKVTS